MPTQVDETTSKLAVALRCVDSMFEMIRDLIGEPLNDKIANEVLDHFFHQLERHTEGYDGQ